MTSIDKRPCPDCPHPKWWHVWSRLPSFGSFATQLTGWVACLGSDCRCRTEP